MIGFRGFWGLGGFRVSGLGLLSPPAIQFGIRLGIRDCQRSHLPKVWEMASSIPCHEPAYLEVAAEYVLPTRENDVAIHFVQEWDDTWRHAISETRCAKQKVPAKVSEDQNAK